MRNNTHYFATAVEDFGVSMEIEASHIKVVTWEGDGGHTSGDVRIIRTFTGRKYWWSSPSSVRLHGEIQEFIQKDMQRFVDGVSPLYLEVARDIETQLGLKPKRYGAGSFHRTAAASTLEGEANG